MRSDLLNRCDQLLESAPQRALSSQKHSIIFDTNILLDRWVFHDPAVSFLDETIHNGSWQSIGHRETLIELIDVISRSQFHLNSEEQDFILKRWLHEVTLITTELSTQRYCRDQDDDKFFALAVQAAPCVLLSKDKKVLKARAKARKLGVTVLNIDQLKNQLYGQ